MARKREFDKDKVLEMAMLHFWKNGYEATSIRDLKKVMGISSSSMYETFGDKRSIFFAALERYCEIERAQVVERAEQTSDVQEFIEGMFISIDRVIPGGEQQYGSMTFNTMAEFGMKDAVLTDLLFKHFIGVAEIVADVLRQGQQKGAISALEDPLHLAHVIISILQGLATIKSMKPDYAYAEAFHKMILRVLKS